METLERLIALLLALAAPYSADALTVYATDAEEQTPCTSEAILTEACATLVIPTADVEVNITQFPIDNGTWAISPWETEVGHFEFTDWFGSGHTLLGGHSILPGEVPGVFAALEAVEVGDEVIVRLGDAEARYLVTETFVTAANDISVIDQNHRNRLTLITCDVPSFDAMTGQYDERLVVVAVRVG